MKVTVTQEHIDNGLRCGCSTCPVALAFRDLFPGYEINVGAYGAYISTPLDRKYFGHPENVVEWITRFDHGYKCDSFSYETVDSYAKICNL